MLRAGWVGVGVYECPRLFEGIVRKGFGNVGGGQCSLLNMWANVFQKLTRSARFLIVLFCWGGAGVVGQGQAWGIERVCVRGLHLRRRR
eukprot:413585-Rhodomonas_salina.1